MTPPTISVVIPTYNRPALLSAALDSLARQSLPRDAYEVVVVDDGSPPETASVCSRYRERMKLQYWRIENSGISAAKNLGLFAASGQIVLFFDDDDIADPDLLKSHVAAHDRHPAENIAVLGFTDWAPALPVSPVMDYVMNVGCFLFAYSHLSHGQELDHTYFWGGRTSCKRALLAQHGVFNQDFRSIIEDVELGYRLSRFGLRVVFNRDAVSHMIRPLTFEQFCARCERQGRALDLFNQLHRDPVVQEYCSIPDPIPCRVEDALTKWLAIRDELPETIAKVHDLETRLLFVTNGDNRSSLIRELWPLYKWSFAASKLMGMVSAIEARESKSVCEANRIPSTMVIP